MKRFLSFIGKVFLVTAGTLAILIVLNTRYKQVMDHPYTDTNKFNYMDSTYNNIQIANIGSSHGEYGFYYETLSKQMGYECFNFAMASQTYNYDYAILSMYRKHFDESSILFIPVSYFSFNNEVKNEEEKQSLNAKYYQFLSFQYIPGYDPFVDLVTHWFPILSAGTDLKKILIPPALKAQAAEVPSAEEFAAKGQSRYDRHMTEKEEYFLPERAEELKKILAFCEQNNITPVLITTPYTTYYSSLVSDDFKTQFQSVINEIAGEYNVPYYDYSEDERFYSHLEYFADADHLNNEGAAIFMETIQEEIPEFKNFLLEIEPYHAGDPSWQPPY